MCKKVSNSRFAHTTGNGNDIIHANWGGENIQTGSGNNLLYFNYGADLLETTIAGGAGQNTLILDTYQGYGSNDYSLGDGSFSNMTGLDILT